MTTKSFLIALFIIGFFNGPTLLNAQEQCRLIECEGDQCGCVLKAQGWIEKARCEGHQWSYLIEKKQVRKRCSGIAARGGPQEFPCVDFKGSIQEFAKCSPQQ